MTFVMVENLEGVATLTLTRGKVNALNPGVISELHESLRSLESDARTRAIILTGSGKFFSFGLDVPEINGYTKDQFRSLLVSFTDLLRYMFLYPKPLVAALNGHAIAGGCMLALACDYRIMVTGKAKISLNEVTFGSSVFTGPTEMLRFWCGSANATTVLASGDMYSAETAHGLKLVDVVVPETELIARARTVASEMGARAASAFAHIKILLRKPIVDRFSPHESAGIDEFLDIWYSPQTQEQVRKIGIN